MKLKECLDKYRSEVGEHCEKLGKSTGPWGLGKKCYLSYTKGQGWDGWDVVKLNIIQRFLRAIRLDYKGTHIDLVGRKIARQPLFADKDCLEAIVSHWSKKNLFIQGNCSIDNAKIIGLPETHLKPIYNAAAAQIIKKIYRPGDVILVEAIKAGVKTKAADSAMTSFLSSDFIIRGWEPKNLEISNNIPNLRNEKYNELLSILTKAKTFVGRKLTDEEIDSFETVNNELILKIIDLNLYYKSKNKLVLNAANNINAAFTESKETKRAIIWFMKIMQILALFEKRHTKKYYREMSPEENKAISDNMKARNDSLIAEITKYRNKGKRVFVCAGAAHLLNLVEGDESVEVRKFLSKDSYCHIVSRLHYGSTIVSPEETVSTVLPG